MKRILVSSKGEQVEVHQKPIGSGNEGTIYTIASPSRLKSSCVKLYANFQDADKRLNKVSYMIEHPPTSIHTDDYTICWPTDLLYESGKFIGFIMPLAFDNSIELDELCGEEIDTILGRPWYKKFGREHSSSFKRRMMLCVNIAFMIHMIHKENKYVIGDLKPQNILVNLAGGVSLVDCDAIQIVNNGEKKFSVTAITPEYAPVERTTTNVNEDILSVSWDTFSLAVIFYEILVGIHPYTASFQGKYSDLGGLEDKIEAGLFVHGGRKTEIDILPPIHNRYEKMPDLLKYLFNKTFEDGHWNYDVRPCTEDWGKTIYKILSDPDIPKSPKFFERFLQYLFYTLLVMIVLVVIAFLIGLYSFFSPR